MDAEFDYGSLTDFHYLFFDLLAGFFHHFFDTCRVDTAIGYQALEAETCNLAAQRVEAGQQDRFRGIVHDQVYAGSGFERADITSFAADDLTFYLIAFQVENGNGVFDSLLRSGTLDRLDNDLAGFFIGFLLGVVDYFLLNANSLCMRLVAQAFNDLVLGFFSCKTSDLFKPADMLFLVLLEFGTFVIDYLDLAVQVFLDGIVFLELFFKAGLFLTERLLFLADPVFRIVYFPVTLGNFFFVGGFQLNKLLFRF